MQRLLAKPLTPLVLGLCLGLAAAAPAAEKGGAKAPPAPPAQPSAGFAGGTGKVLETLDSGGYTYVNVDVGGKAVWAAGPQVKVKKGQTVTVPPGAAMPNFHSKTLNRTFDVVYFVPAIDVGGKPAAKGGASPAASSAPSAHAKPTVDKAKVTGIAKAKGGKTVAELFAGGKSLDGKEVVVRGKVVKFSSGIMGKNWIHLQDGTGAVGTSDLTVTTAGTAAVGDVVLVKGKLAANKDFGMGYRYDVIVEDAKVTK